MDQPPKYSDRPFVKDYRDPFYDNHVLYQAFGVYRDDSFETINDIWKERMTRGYVATTDAKQHDAWGDYVILILASEKFINKQCKELYDYQGDPKFSRTSLTRKSEYPEFYNDHILYVVAGAQRYDNPQQTLDAFKISAYRVIRDKPNLDLVHSAQVQTFKLVWYHACYRLLDYIRRREYDEVGDQGKKFNIIRSKKN